jgi:integrase
MRIFTISSLDHGERERRGSIGTRNCRLAAIRAFFAFSAAREPVTIAPCAAILHVPNKRADRPALCYLDAGEVEAILAQPDQSTLEGQRDHALFSFLYNTGARIQEALDLCPNAIRFSAPHRGAAHRVTANRATKLARQADNGRALILIGSTPVFDVGNNLLGRTNGPIDVADRVVAQSFRRRVILARHIGTHFAQQIECLVHPAQLKKPAIRCRKQSNGRPLS